MTVTVQEVMDAGIFPMATEEDVLWVQAGLDWLDVYTTLPIDKLTLDTLPPGAKLFLQQYRDLMQRYGIASESIEGLSQSFTDDSIDDLLIDLALRLLPKWMKAVSFVPKQQLWKYHKGGARRQW